MNYDLFGFIGPRYRFPVCFAFIYTPCDMPFFFFVDEDVFPNEHHTSKSSFDEFYSGRYAP